LAGRKFTAASLEDELRGWLAQDAAAAGTEVGESEWRLEFTADRPVICKITGGQIHLHLRLAEFSDSNTSYPAVSVRFILEPRQDETDWSLKRIGAAEAYPLDYEPGTGKSLNGRQLVLRRAVQRSLEGTLRESLVINPLKLQRSGAAAQHVAPRAVRAESGWLSIHWQAPAATTSIAGLP